ncbi:MAG TPA: aspartate carbamoyltransferase [Opitutae bacterium]|nr:aspartate carbamoyltransferase [Opitutae bacterium]|tara:strand:- start:49 stop:996 length:948 start_codon:yes stop_codon:yes gene_type:complete
MKQVWTRKDLIGLEDLSREEIIHILTTAQAFEEALKTDPRKLPNYAGKVFINLFMEASTRTRVAFEMAALKLGASTTTITQSGSSLTKGETLRDTAQNLEALFADAIILRDRTSGAAKLLSEHVKVPVINAGDGAHEHPTQGLLDAYTLCKYFGQDLSGKHIAIVGDIRFSRVARSNIWCLKKLGASITLVGPTSLVPKEFEQFGVTVSHDLDALLEDLDAIMMLRIQKERQGTDNVPSLGEYRKLFGLTETRAKRLKPEARILHPGPMNRGVEIDSVVADSKQAVILEQVSHGVIVRMAVFHLCLSATQNTLSA